MNLVLDSVPYLLGTGALSVIVASIRWFFRVERSFNEQSVINSKTLAGLDRLLLQLQSHEALVETRAQGLDQRADSLETRILALENRVASGTLRR